VLTPKKVEIMKKVFRKSVFVAAIILTSSAFINCDRTSAIKKNETATLAVNKI
jgi:hypothetical protein